MDTSTTALAMRMGFLLVTVHGDHKIQAIKDLRQRLGYDNIGLADAKDIIFACHDVRTAMLSRNRNRELADAEAGLKLLANQVPF